MLVNWRRTLGALLFLILTILHLRFLNRSCILLCGPWVSMAGVVTPVLPRRSIGSIVLLRVGPRKETFP